MPKRSISTHEAKTHLSRVIEEVLAGAEVVVCRGETPVVKIVKYQKGDSAVSRQKVGVVTSAPVLCSDDAFAPLSREEELAEWGLK
jgi:antitoxin (DNA-binding transcriptional repressor) of toxin-antitoxin stability system